MQEGCDWIHEGPVTNEASAQNCAAAYPEHDCFAWQRQCYCSDLLSQHSECGTCGRITGFRWKKVWPRIRSLFTSEPLRKTTEKY